MNETIEEPPKGTDVEVPKPARNWRGWVKEYAIVVMGVATALAAEQTVEWLHWQHRVNDAVKAIEIELRDDNGPAAYIRAAAVTCLDRRLDDIQKAIEDKRSRAEIAALVRRYAPPPMVWDRNAWDALLASDAASHVTPDRMIKWGYVYSMIAASNARREREVDSLSELNPIRQSGDMLSESEEDTMLTAVLRLRTTNRGFGGGGVNFLRFMEHAGITLTQDQKNQILGDLRSVYSGCVVEPSIPGFGNGDSLTSASRALKRREGRP